MEISEETDDREEQNMALMVIESRLLSLPDSCIEAVISFTTPRDLCSLSCVSSFFKFMAETDAVWDRFLPLEYVSAIPDHIVSSSVLPSSKKELYFWACHNPVLMKDSKLSFWLDKPSGKKCYMISTMSCKIEWGDTPIYWSWISIPDIRFPVVAKLNDVCYFDIEGTISTSLLSPRTTYEAYLVFKPTGHEYGFLGNPMDAIVRLVGNEGQKRTVYLDTDRDFLPWYAWEEVDHFPWHAGLFSEGEASTQSMPEKQDDEEEDPGIYVPRERGDGWLETQLGEFVYEGHEDGELEIIVMEIHRGNWKSGLIFEGIEIRPKSSR